MGGVPARATHADPRAIGGAAERARTARATRRGRALLLALLLLPAPALAGPREFGRAELARALVERGLPPGSVNPAAEIRPGGPPESFDLAPGLVTAPDERGLMYGLLAAAEQVRETGGLRPERGHPRTAVRGVRTFMHNEALEEGWYFSDDYWSAYFATLARARLNRLDLVFAHQTDYLAPPYPYWLGLPDFPGVRVPGLTPERRARNLDRLCRIADAAADHGVDLTLGVWEHDVPTWLGLRRKVEGLTPENIGPYSRAALGAVLRRCASIRSVQLRTGDESGIPPDRQVTFYRDHVFPALREAGRPVALDLRGWMMPPGLMDAAENAGVPLRVSAKYWAEHLGRPYQPAESFPGYGYLDLLRRPRPYGFLWELWGLGTHRLLLWGDPGYVRRAVPTLALGGADGFEIDQPLAQKGFGDAPGTWGVFAAPELDRRRSWTWEFERYWLFYALWGRLSYDPDTPASAWEGELRRRLGPAAGDVMAAYEASGPILGEIVAAHLPDPNMALWPEINPGGLVDAYVDDPAGDPRLVATPREAAADLLAGRASARQTPVETAARLDGWADATERALDRAAAAVDPGDREWLSSEPDFRVLALLARYHARKQRAALDLALFDATGDPAPLARARAEVEAGIGVWEGLVRLTDGLYPDDMAFGPEEVGHWGDKLPYVRHDLELVAERERTLRDVGRFRLGLDLGTGAEDPGSVEPRFRAVGADLLFDQGRGYGWAAPDARRRAVAPLPTPLAELRGVARGPRRLPVDRLYGDHVAGEGAQTFLVAAAPGEHTVVLLRPDRTASTRTLRTDEAGRLAVTLDGAWALSGLVVDPAPAGDGPAAPRPGPTPPRPPMRHEPPATWPAGRDLPVRLELADPAAARSVRLHYRALDQLAAFRTLEAPPSDPSFTIPGAAVGPGADLMYYFEVLGRDGGGWFEPDPHATAPYHVVRVR